MRRECGVGFRQLRTCPSHTSGAAMCQARALADLLDHMVGAHQDGGRKRDRELFGGLHVDGEFQFGWQLDREIGGGERRSVSCKRKSRRDKSMH